MIIALLVLGIVQLACTVVILLKTLQFNAVISNLENFINCLVEVLKKHGNVYEEQTVRTIELIEKMREVKRDISSINEQLKRKTKGTINGISK